MLSNVIESGQFVLNSAYVLIGLGVFVIAQMLVQEQESRAAQENLAELRDRNASNFLVKITRPFFTQYVVPMLRGKSFWDEKRKLYRRRIVSGGLVEELTPDEFIAFKLFLILFFPIVGGVLNAGGFLELPIWGILGSGVAGWFYPDFWVKGRIAKRHTQIVRAMPFIVDLLALSTEAGLDFIGAIGKVVEKAAPSPIVDEFAQLLREIKIGSSRQEALREMAARVDMQEVNSFVTILISADQMGASIGKTLRQQSDQIRSERMVRAEKAGARAAQLIIMPIVFLIVPSVLIMIGAPFALEIFYGGGQ